MKGDLQKNIEKLWPTAKNDLEVFSKETSKILKKGEEYLKDFSEKSAKKAETLVLQVKKEQLYYQLGKKIASTAKASWAESKEIASYCTEIKKLEQQIKLRTKR